MCLLWSLGQVVNAGGCSEDHRGTPEAPGRVVTLIDRDHWASLVDKHHITPSEKVWGAAYHIPTTHARTVRDYLDVREINGYSIRYTPFHAAAAADADSTVSSEPAAGGNQHRQRQTINKCMVYIGLPSNPQFLGPQDPAALARHILQSRGPSGENVEYLFQLETALNGLSAESRDEHVSDLAGRCRDLQKAAKGEAGGERGGERGRMENGGKMREGEGVELKKVGSTEEQEEVEKTR
ncbi:hypothetical protein LTS18_011463 [Coniosporium uncinatum]|uniref:Uncharacterized protein n=1 Tax=Coniosporium uncinatum TaxID=93489 RepID=A0ACC3CYG4_9PEZI|nr:hypothetical protein LTS18_011463 [Coniosporium uncinatum]